MHGVQIGGRWCPTKKAMREALVANPASVLFVDTAFGQPLKSYRADEMPVGLRIYIVGPDPANKRDWYANVVRKENGTHRVN